MKKKIRRTNQPHSAAAKLSYKHLPVSKLLSSFAPHLPTTLVRQRPFSFPCSYNRSRIPISGPCYLLQGQNQAAPTMNHPQSLLTQACSGPLKSDQGLLSAARPRLRLLAILYSLLTLHACEIRARKQKCIYMNVDLTPRYAATLTGATLSARSL